MSTDSWGDRLSGILSSGVERVRDVALFGRESELDGLLREATLDKPWGCSKTVMLQVSKHTYGHKDLEHIEEYLFKLFRAEKAAQWRRVFKALQLLDCLLKHGSERFVEDVRRQQGALARLTSIELRQDGADLAAGIRNLSKAVLATLNDHSRLAEERALAKQTQSRYVGMGSDHVGHSSSAGMLAQRSETPRQDALLKPVDAVGIAAPVVEAAVAAPVAAPVAEPPSQERGETKEERKARRKAERRARRGSGEQAPREVAREVPAAIPVAAAAPAAPAAAPAASNLLDGFGSMSAGNPFSERRAEGTRDVFADIYQKKISEPKKTNPFSDLI